MAAAMCSGSLRDTMSPGESPSLSVDAQHLNDDDSPFVMRVRAGAHVVDIFTNHEPFAQVVRHRLADLATFVGDSAPDSAAISIHVKRRDDGWVDWGVWRDGEPQELALAEDYVLFQLQWELNYLVLNEDDDSIHAAAVEIDGGALILPGSSGSGKTTFAGYLACQGAPFVADEAVLLDSGTGQVLPYPRPLGLHRGGPLADRIIDPDRYSTPFDGAESLVPASDLGATITTANTLPIRALVFPHYHQGDGHEGHDGLTPLAPSDAFDRVCASAPALVLGRTDVFGRLAELVRRVPAAELVTNDLEGARTHLLDWLAEHNGAAS